MENTSGVKTGPWIHYSRGYFYRWQWTTSAQHYLCFQLLLAVLVGAIAPLAIDFFIHSLAWTRYSWHKPPSHDAGERERLLSAGATTRRKSNLQCGGLSVYVVTKFVTTAVAIAGVFATSVPADSVGLSGSHHCGSWSLKDNAGKAAQESDDLIQAQKERRAGQYGRDCYDYASVTMPDRCQFFETQALSYQTQTEQQWPFEEKSICSGNAYSAVRFSTGLLDANDIGVNTDKAIEFNRTTICAALDMEVLQDRGWLKEVEIPVIGDYLPMYGWEYWLGPVSNSYHRANYTFSLLGDPFTWDIPAYKMNVYERTPFGDMHNYWKPIPQLSVSHPGPHYLALMFVSSCHILYTKPSQDYIFPATEIYPPNSDLWRNDDPRARPLACVDWNEICTDGNCYPMEEPHPEHGLEFEFTRWAIKKSTTFHAVQFQLGSALVAQEAVEAYRSLPLPEDQWIVESKALFNTSLARIQYDAYDFALGVGHEWDPGKYNADLPDWARGKMCGFYKFQLPKGYTNINLTLTALLLIIVLIVFILGCETPWEFEDELKTSKLFPEKMIGLDLIIERCGVWIGWLQESGVGASLSGYWNRTHSRIRGWQSQPSRSDQSITRAQQQVRGYGTLQTQNDETQPDSGSTPTLNHTSSDTDTRSGPTANTTTANVEERVPDG